MVAGVVRRDGVFVRCRGRLHRLPRTRQTVTAFVATVEQDVCEVCGGTVCDCITPAAQAAMLARISADPHDYNNLSTLDLPY